MLGKEAEDLALNLLKKQGLHPITQNWHAKGGELDLVMLDGDTVVFIEVRYRKQAKYGSAIESINWRKQQRIIIAAQHFLVNNLKWQNYNCRFDVVIFDGKNSSKWLKSAFDGI